MVLNIFGHEKRLSVLEKIIEAIPTGIYFVDRQRKLLLWNKGAEKITGFNPNEVENRFCYDDILCHIDDSGKKLCNDGCPLHQTLIDGKNRTAKVFLKTKDGARIPVSVFIKPIFEDDVLIGAVESFTDLSKVEEKTRQLEDLKKLALIDKSSNLPNQDYLRLEFNKKVDLLRTKGMPFCLIKINIDDLGKIENSFGPVIVNSIFKVISHTMLSIMRKNDVLGRFSYTSVLILSPYKDDKQFKSWIKLIELLLKNCEFNIPVDENNISNLKYNIKSNVIKKESDIIDFNNFRSL
ncbi:MAG: hypothetical protein C0601_06490 [Candidatus Muiribacterium halophilum]|uniref:Diguanylate cyclase n=1 Tax=Muiribacterium halophilum TaxID=2053465 RepID=A0A2N5ZGC7_MUIH1|nr:MAG: hypothetical protein C0601_06490 [Candidatus Muirbacterium halophilum]